MNEILWQRVEAALDERRSPFDDPGLVRDLVASPETAAAARRLLERLGRIAPRSGLPAARPSRWPWILAVAAAVLMVMTVSWIGHVLQPAEAGASASPRVTTLSLVFERGAPPPAADARVSLVPQRVVEWTLEGDHP